MVKGLEWHCRQTHDLLCQHPVAERQLPYNCSISDSALCKCVWQGSKRYSKCLSPAPATFQPGPALALRAIWEVSQQTNDLALSLCLSNKLVFNNNKKKNNNNILRSTNDCSTPA